MARSLLGMVIASEDKVNNNLWNSYLAGSFFDEMYTASGNARAVSRDLIKFFKTLSPLEMRDRHLASGLTIREMGISFTVYSDDRNIDRDWPFDIIPRAIALRQWDSISKGLKQRTKALNFFINDVYNEQKIFSDGIVPRDIVLNSVNFKEACVGFSPAFGAWAQICGTDLVRDHTGKFFVLEDNLRVPSGVAYMLENREVTKRVLPELFEDYSISPVDDYSSQLHKMLSSLSPRKLRKPVIVVLTPGIFNSAYFEHSFLARSIGAELVEGADLFVDSENFVYMHTVDGPVRVDVIYRRIDDDFLDPEVFRKDSMIGVPGLIRAWRSKRVAIANSPGSGVADDKVVYAYVPRMIEYYLDEKPIVSNVETYLCCEQKAREYVIENIKDLVVKPANESGGYGLMVGPNVTEKEHERFKRRVNQYPRNYVAQPTLKLSTAPTYVDGKVEPRHLDLRPFVLTGADSYVTPGGLTRVALGKGSLVVNSSQGGGSKDTWIVDTGAKNVV
jgi:uncharacterized circularly permuted ATP-grasp superfamily protein